MTSQHFRTACAAAAAFTCLLPSLGCPSALTNDSAEPDASAAPHPDQISALLINGGGRRQTNYYSHLDHLRRLIAILDATTVDASRIAVFSGDGSNPAPDLATREGRLPPHFWLLPRDEARRLRPPVRYLNSEIAGTALRPATGEALRTWFEDEGSGLSPGSTLLLYVTDHGEQNSEDPLDNSITLWGDRLSVIELRELLDHLDPRVRVVMLMSQCYSGGFASAVFPEGAEAPPVRNACGYFSAPADRKAHGCYSEISGREAEGYSHRIFDALAGVQRLPDAHREVLVSDGTPDVPNTTLDFYLSGQLERTAALGGHETQDFVDMLLAEAWESPSTWEREIRLLDRLGHAFGFSSTRSLAQIEEQATGLSELRKQLDNYARLWQRALDALRRENLKAFRTAHPESSERVGARALDALSSDERRREIERYLGQLARFTDRNAERDARLRELNRKAAEAKSVRYRADVRLAAVLRMRALLMQVAGRHYMEQYASDLDRSTFEQLEACEDLALLGGGSTVALDTEPAKPFPTLDQERQEIEAIVPGWLGLHYRSPRKTERNRHELPSGAAVVTTVLPDSPAAEAALNVADIILGPPGTPFSERHGLREWVMQGEIGSPLPMRLLREGRQIEVVIRLQHYPTELPALPGPPQIGSVAPKLELDYLPGSRTLEPGGARLVLFWATWCQPCKNALPEVLAFARDRDIPVVAITDEGAEEVDSFKQEYPAPVPQVIATDPHRKEFRKYGVSGTPTIVLVDGDGIVRHYQTGYKAGQPLRIEAPPGKVLD